MCLLLLEPFLDSEGEAVLFTDSHRREVELPFDRRGWGSPLPRGLLKSSACRSRADHRRTRGTYDLSVRCTNVRRYAGARFRSEGRKANTIHDVGAFEGAMAYIADKSTVLRQ